MTGTVKRFIVDFGWGWISGDNGVDVFVHHSQVVDPHELPLGAGDRVEFDVVMTERGSRAIGVRLIREQRRV